MTTLIAISRWLISLLPIVALAGPLDRVETAINAGHPELVMTENAASHWERTYSPNGGILDFLGAKRVGDRALTRAYWASPNPPYTQSSWILFRFKDDLIDSWIWTQDAPPAYWSPGAPEGQAADVATTAVGLSQGFVEANPVVAASVPVASVIKVDGSWLAQQYGSPELCESVQKTAGPLG